MLVYRNLIDVCVNLNMKPDAVLVYPLSIKDGIHTVYAYKYYILLLFTVQTMRYSMFCKG